MTNFCIGLDLGSDTLKIAYTYSRCGNDYTGKIVGSNLSMTAIPSVAYYDAKNGGWVFGEDVEKISESSTFATVVKIKRLLMLLANLKDEKVCESNEKFYFERNEFPNFYFPRRGTDIKSFEELYAKKMTFNVPSSTPKSVCEGFFEYVAALARARVGYLAERLGILEYQIKVSLVYPPYVGERYVNEISRLAERAFLSKPERVWSMTKALSVYARKAGLIGNNEHVLIFNMGEEEVSVVKAGIVGGALAVDGVEGHNGPLAIGGNDIDDAVADYLEGRIEKRETMGSPSFGDVGHIVESGLNSKQYLFVKDIKMAKLILGKFAGDERHFKKGVPVCVSRDLYVQRYLTKEEFAGCLGIKFGNGVAAQIENYIKSELDRGLNSDVKKVFLSGGLVETLGLVDYLKEKIEPLGVKVQTFEKSSFEQDGEEAYEILDYEDALYAPSLGSAIAVRDGINVKIALALSYGLRLFFHSDTLTNDVPFYAILVRKGTVLKDESVHGKGCNKFMKSHITSPRAQTCSANMNVISAPIDEDDIQDMKGYPAVKYFRAPEGYRLRLPHDPAVANKEMDGLKRAIGMQIISGGGHITFWYRGRRVVVAKDVFISVGVQIDENGVAYTIVENDVDGNGFKRTYVNFMDGDRVTSECAEVYMRDLEFELPIEKFKIPTND